MTDSAEDLDLRRTAFRFLPEGEHARLRAILRRERFEFGHVVVRQGDVADAYYVITSGRARVVRETERGEELSLETLRPGDEFGEATLVDGGTRSATVRCSTAVEVLRLGREDFLGLVRQSPAVKHAVELAARFKTLHGFLYEFSNFGRLPAACLHRLVERLEAVSFSKGETILREGDPAGPLYIVQDGRVRVFTSAGGRARNLAFRRAGDFFGELSALSGAPRSASAEASADCRLLALPPEAVTALRDEFPEFRALMEERVAQYRADTEARIPLDFAEEMLPADASVRDKVALPEEAPADPRDREADGEDGASSPGETAKAARGRRGRFRLFPFVAQIDEMDCGAASLGMVCRHYGRNVSLPRIRDLCHTSTDGTSLKAICHAAGELGLAARAAKVSPGHLAELPLPAVVHYEGNHWVVLYDVGEDHVRVADPARGRRKIPRGAFEERWTGFCALFDYTTDFERAPERRPTLAWLRPFFAKFRSILLQVLLLAAAVSGLQLLIPVFTQTVFDSVIVDRDAGLLTLVMIAIGASVVFMIAANLCQQYLLAFAAVRIDTAILDYLTRQLLALPMRYFQSRRTGDIQRRLDGAQEVREFVVHHGIGGLLAAVQLLGCVLLMLLYSPLLAVAFLAVVPLYGVLVFLSIKYLKPILVDLEESRGRYRSHQIDAIKGIAAVKAAAAEGAFRDGMLNQFLTVSKQTFRGTFFFMSYDNAVQTLAVVSTALFLWIGAGRVMDGTLTMGEFVAFNTLVAMAHAAVLRLLATWEKLLTASVLLNRLDDVFEQEPEQGRDRSRLKPVPSLEGHIELRDVGFRYGGPESPSILSGITLEIPAGRTVALVGRSGCGKTTLVHLVAGLLEPTEGKILFDRMDLASVDHRDLRRHIGLVLQENHVFDGTIRENIAFGEPDPDFDRVLWAAHLASAHDFVTRLPLGYETRIGESGLSLSGGQKQRVAIARALYADPPVLIFDEATSALDSESERAIQNNMAELLSGRTSIVIAHRLSTIREADQIVVMEKGAVAEVGTHDELMARRGLYFYLSTQQSGI